MNEHSFIFVPCMRVRDLNKEKIIREKAIEIIVKKGFDGLSMQKLAKAAGVSPATIYIYFKDRSDLIEQIAIHAVDTLVTETFVGFSPDMNFEQGMRIQWENRAKYWIHHPLEAQFMEQVKYSPVGQAVQTRVKEEFSSVMRVFIQNAIKNNELKPLPVEVFWSIAFAPLYKLIKFHLDGKGMHTNPFKLNNKILNQTLEQVLKALRP